jgi:hypothetical protein
MNMNTETETATPMVVYDESRAGEHLRYVIVGPGGCNQPIAYGVPGAGADVFERIVAAVNAHDRLVVACEAALRTIREDAPALMEPRWGPDSGEHGTVRKLRAALALARGD